jgi:hypothetical protein
LVRLHRYIDSQISIAPNGTSDCFELHTGEDAMTASMRASLTAIGRLLQAEYSPTLARSLPAELEELVAQLVALEAGKRGSTSDPSGYARRNLPPGQ